MMPAGLSMTYARRLTHLFVKDVSWLEDRAAGLVSAHDAGVPAALNQIRAWHPKFAEVPDDAIRSSAFGIHDARVTYANQHGFRSWPEMMARVDALRRGDADEPFMRAFEALGRADLPQLSALVREHPDLLNACGTNGNTLLNLAVSLAGSMCGPLPPQAGAIFKLLLGLGSDVNLANDRGWTPLHQAAYTNRGDLAQHLLGAGAACDREAHGDGGTPLAVALFWGHRDVSDVLAAHGIVSLNLRIAAGLGRRDLILRQFDTGGALTSDAGRGRGFYRPHSGFPVWQRSDTRQEILDEALVWACKSNRVEVLGLLADHGARVEADPYRGTPLLWASACAALDAVRWLLDYGADVNQQATFGGPGHGEGVTALHLAAERGDMPMIQLLCAAGADVTIKDGLYGSTPVGWADHNGCAAAREYLRSKSS